MVCCLFVCFLVGFFAIGRNENRYEPGLEGRKESINEIPGRLALIVSRLDYYCGRLGSEPATSENRFAIVFNR